MKPTPRFVMLSLSVYRLLLAAYPKRFRSEYGDLMMQLFRDAALDAYQSSGLRGLLAIWPWTLADFACSVGRQHREETLRQSQELSLRYLIHQWLALAGVLLSVLVLTARYMLQLLLRRPLRTCAVTSVMILVLWSLSFQNLRFLSFRVKVVPDGLWCAIHDGVMDFDNGYSVRHRPPAQAWEFGFFSADRHFRDGWLRHVWLLRFPVPVLFVFVPLFYIGTLPLRTKDDAGPAMLAVATEM